MNTTLSNLRILAADDDANILRIIKLRLEANGYTVETAGTTEDALSKCQKNAFDLALVDLRFGADSGIDFMIKLHEINPEIPVIILTGFGSIDTAVEAMQLGAYSYIKKPFDYNDLLSQIERCLENKTQLKEVKSLPPLLEQTFGFETVIGKNEKMKQAFALANQAANSESSVYIEGESGTGKELIARIVHAASPRKDKPFIVINCAALPDTLFESELFGYERGAFTGAHNRREGFFVQADGGSIFLDEISEIPLTMQSKLLRVLQEKEFYPLGGKNIVKIDARLISTSNRTLKTEVENGSFREDLFYRIHVIEIKLPPLRERKEDIPLLADFFLKKFCKKNNKNIKGFSAGAMQMLVMYNWPGNIRELKNEIESAVVLAKKNVITEEVIFPNKKGGIGPMKPFKKAKADFEKKYLTRLIDLTNGNMSKAANLSGKYRADLYQMMKKYDLDPMDFRRRND